MTAPPELNIHSVVVAAPQQVSSDLAGETVILNLHDSSYYGLDEVGTRIWALIQTPIRVADIRDALLDEYDVEAAQCEADLLDLLREMAKRRLMIIQQEEISPAGRS